MIKAELFEKIWTVCTIQTSHVSCKGLKNTQSTCWQWREKRVNPPPQRKTKTLVRSSLSLRVKRGNNPAKWRAKSHRIYIWLWLQQITRFFSNTHGVYAELSCALNPRRASTLHRGRHADHRPRETIEVTRHTPESPRAGGKKFKC